MLLGKNKLDTIEVLLFKTLVDSYIIPNEFASLNDGLREYNMFKEEIKKFQGIHYKWKQWKPIVSVLKKINNSQLKLNKKD